MAPKTKKRRNVPRLPIRDDKGWHKAQEQLSLELQQHQQDTSSDASTSDDEGGSGLKHSAEEQDSLDNQENEGLFSFLAAIEEQAYQDDDEDEEGDGEADDETGKEQHGEKVPFGLGKKNKENTKRSTDVAGETHLEPEDYRILVGSLAAELIEDPMTSLANLKKLLSMIKAQSSIVKRLFLSAGPAKAIVSSGLSDSHSNSVSVENRSEHEARLKLLLISCLAIFQDILPGYGIRSLTSIELATKVTKEIRQQRDYESSLLSCYKQYLTTLLSFIIQVRRSPTHASSTTKSKSTAPISYPAHVCHVAMKCLLELLLLASAQHNYFRELVDSLSFILFNDKRGTLIDLAAKALVQGFSEDETGFFTWSIVKVLSEDCQKHHYYIPVKILESFISIKVGNLKASSRSDDAGRRSHHKKKAFKSEEKSSNRVKAAHISKRNKKYLKEELKWKKELEETEATISQDQLNLWHQESLRYLFRIYIGLIKKNPTAPLLTFVFPGLLKFSDMIHEDYFADLLVSLKHILPSILTHTKTSILCLTAVFTILTQQSQFLQLDLHWYYKVLYGLMLQMPTRKLGLEMHPVKHVNAHKAGGSFGKKTKKAKVITTTTTQDATLTPTLSLPLNGQKVSSVTHVWKPIQEQKGQDEDASMIVDPELVPAFMACFDKMFLGRMQVPLDRVAAFMHRMIWICLSLDTSSILLLTDLLLRMFRHYSNLVPLLLSHTSDEGDSFGSGAYDPLFEDPDQCHASSESILPLVELLMHLHPSREVKSKMTQLFKLYQGN